MADRRSVLLWCALGCNVLLAATTVGVYGWTPAGIHAAARNTARFASLWFVVAFAAPGLTRFVPLLPTEERLTRAYVAGHLVHFAVVSLLILTFDSAHVLQAPGRSAAIVLVGFVIVMAVGMTARPRLSRLHAAARSFALYAIFGIFFLAFVHNSFTPVRLLAIVFAVALVLRLGGVYFAIRLAKLPTRSS